MRNINGNLLRIMVPFILITYSSQGMADVLDSDQEQPAIGNFALPSTHQMGPLLSFGQNIFDKGTLELSFSLSDMVGNDMYEIEGTSTMLYGVTDNFSVGITVPFDLRNQAASQYSDGIEDTLLQFEYQFYSKSTNSDVDGATIVTNISIPTGSSTKNPPTGFGAPSFFLGTTYAHMSVDWYSFTSFGANFTTTHSGTKYGNEYLYQGGLGRNIASAPSEWIFSALVEIDGVYALKDQINQITDPNSGGNVILVTPSLWLSLKNLNLQLGIGFPVVQNLFGQQEKNHYLLASNVSFTLS